MSEMPDAERFAEFEAEHNLFLREYKGFPYWQILRYELCRHLFSEQVVVEKQIYKTTGNSWKIKKQFANLKDGILGHLNCRSIHKADLLMTLDSPRHSVFYESWLNDVNVTTCNISYQRMDKCHNMCFEMFLTWFIYHIKKFFHVIKRDKEEYLFLSDLELRLKELFGRSLTANEMERIIQYSTVEDKVFERYWKKVFNVVKPKAFVTVCYYTTQRYPAYREAKKRGIPIIEFQHGTIINHTQYLFADTSGVNNYVPDYLLVFGDNWKKQVKMPKGTKVVSVGYPYQEEEIAKLDSVKMHSDVVIIYPTPVKEYEEMIKDFAQKASSIGYRVFAKIHPNEAKEVEQNYPVLSRCSSIEMITDQSKSVYYWLKYGMHHVVTNSTVAIEAVSIDGTNVCVAEEFPHDTSLPLLESGVAKSFRDADELLKIIQDYKCPSNSTQRNLWWMSNGKENIIRFFQQQIKVF